MTSFNTDNEDNVFNLIEKPEEKFIKSPRYQSVHKERMKCEIAKMKCAHRTLGIPKVSLKLPKDFLKKQSHLKIEKPKVNHVHYRRPGYQHNLPKWTSIKICSSSSQQFQEFPRDPIEVGRLNFRKQNIENVKNHFSKPVNLKVVYTRHGDNHELIQSGLMPTYIHKKNFGQVPAYLKKISSASCSNKKHQDRTDHKLNKQACRYITQEEREKLLEEMKKQWTEIIKQFQCLPFLIDTVPKIKRKVTIEQKLRQLEKDIDLLENHRYIYVYDDNDIKY